jgi:hypothetical protein
MGWYSFRHRERLFHDKLFTQHAYRMLENNEEIGKLIPNLPSWVIFILLVFEFLTW